MRLKHLVLFLAFLGFTSLLKAQHGQLIVEVYMDGEDLNSLEFQSTLELRNELGEWVYAKSITQDYKHLLVDSLKPGRYILTLKVGTDYTSQQRLWIKDGQITQARFDWSTVDINKSILYLDSTSTEFCPTLYFSPGSLNAPANYPIANVYGIGFNSNYAMWMAPHLSFLGNFNFSGFYADFKKHWQSDSAASNSRTRMLQINAEFGMGLRWHAHRIKNGPETLVIDAAAKYNLPLYFNQATIQGTKRQVDWGLHQFKNFSAYGRIGFKYVGLIAEYRLSNYIISGFPELPRWTFGIQAMLPND